jgi:hypothetical protein
MSDEAAAYYQDLFTRIYESDEWQAYLESESLSPLWMDADAQRAYWATQVENHRELLAPRRITSVSEDPANRSGDGNAQRRDRDSRGSGALFHLPDVEEHRTARSASSKAGGRAAAPGRSGFRRSCCCAAA